MPSAFEVLFFVSLAFLIINPAIGQEQVNALDPLILALKGR